MAQIIRFAIVHSDSGQVETGANYPGCSAANPNACQPLSFAKLADAQGYAQQNGELLYVMGAALPDSAQWQNLANQVWKYVANPNLLPPPAPVSSLLPGSGVSLPDMAHIATIGAALIGLYLLL